MIHFSELVFSLAEMARMQSSRNNALNCIINGSSTFVCQYFSGKLSCWTEELPHMWILTSLLCFPFPPFPFVFISLWISHEGALQKKEKRKKKGLVPHVTESGILFWKIVNVIPGQVHFMWFLRMWFHILVSSYWMSVLRCLSVLCLFVFALWLFFKGRRKKKRKKRNSLAYAVFWVHTSLHQQWPRSKKSVW